MRSLNGPSWFVKTPFPGSEITLLLKEKPRGTDTYLNYELTEIICYHFHDRSHICSFNDQFPEVLRPYFCIRRDLKSLTICSGTDE
ncbi:hypothetical protein GH733_008453 [Mirounga leonina]|nr:hypothetical protein GH733_008453 [Mirounga leonina]